jgi:pimeloyl-ACP methyl ester carboxylesterase
MNKISRSIVQTAMLLVFVANLGLAQTAASTEKQIEVFGQKISYREAGSGPSVILLHGLGADASQWTQTIAALAPRYHVYALDQIGFGKSDKPMINYRVATLVSFLREFYDKAGVTKATLVGNSLGGWTAAAFTIAYPDKVEKLVLVDAAGYSPERIGAPKPTLEMMLALNASTPEGMKTTLDLVLYNKQLITEPFIKQAFAEKLRRNDGYTINMFIESVLRGEDQLDGKVGAIKVPTLIVWGKEDILTPISLGNAFKEDIKGSEIIIIDKCAHVPHLECAGPFMQVLTKFLGGAQAVGSGR